MSEYVSWIEANNRFEKVLPSTITALETRGEPVNTGLLNRNGHPIYRMPEKIGFDVMAGKAK